MAICNFCGKTYQKGNKISHSAIKTIKRTYPNIRVKNMVVNGVNIRVKVCAKCLKSLDLKNQPKKPF